jgi:hypothetical protein
MTDPNEVTLDTLGAKWSDRQVATEADAREFVDDCERLIGGGFHPDTRMEDYVISGSGRKGPELTAVWHWESTFSADDAEVLEDRITEAFAVLGAAGLDIYEISLDLYHHYNPQENSK